MKKLLIFGLMVGLLLLVACSQARPGDRSVQGYNQGRMATAQDGGMRAMGQRGPMMNMSDEQRQQFMEERQRLGVEACSGKSEGDACAMSSPREMRGSCILRDDVLSCMPTRLEGRGLMPQGGQRMPPDGIMPPPEGMMPPDDVA